MQNNEMIKSVYHSVVQFLKYCIRVRIKTPICIVVSQHKDLYYVQYGVNSLEFMQTIITLCRKNIVNFTKTKKFTVCINICRNNNI